MMKKFMKKGLILACILGMSISGSAYAETLNAENNAAAEPAVVAQEASMDMKAVIDWTKGEESNVTAIGIGVPNPKVSAAQGAVLARTAAIVDAQRNLLSVIKGAQIDADTLVEDMMVTSDVVKRKIGGVLVGAVILEEGQNPDGSYIVKMGVPLYGSEKSVAAAVMPEVVKDIVTEPIPTVDVEETTLAPEVVKEVKTVLYTGIVIDADGLGLQPTFSPVIYDTNGRVIYGIKNLDKEAAISKGVVGYANEVGKATYGSRAGDNPLVIKAVEVRGGMNSVNKVNVVVSVEDADKILLANEVSHMLDACAVVFVK